jgi:sodium-dependent dicarboxylate transporter 2/3/5
MFSRLPNPLVFWRSIVTVVAPVILIAVPLCGDLQNRNALWCLYTILVMAVYWVCECLPLAITSMLPLVLLPFLGVNSTKEVSANYLNSTNMMFLAGLMMAVAVEHCNLHHRIALNIISFVGTSQKKLMLGFMMCTMFLSMWISNTATTAMMVPIVDAISAAISFSDEDIELENKGTEDAKDSKKEKRSSTQENSRNFLLLSCAYASNIGGTGVITGSPPNLVVLNVLNNIYGEGVAPLSYASWMGFCVPLMLVNVLLAWGWILLLQWLQGGRKTETRSADQELKVKKVILQKKKELGKMSQHEFQVLILFIILVLLWFFKSPVFITGWGDDFSKPIGSATPAVLIVALLFMLPKEWSMSTSSPALLDWITVEKRLPWGVIMLLGGGFALAHSTKSSGLSKYLVDQLDFLKSIESLAVNFIIAISTTMVTEVASNTATANILVPILSTMSRSLCSNPLYLMMTAAVTCSYAFMLPVATAPNAIVFGASTMKTVDMMKAGIVMNIVCVLTTFGAINSYGVAMFRLDCYPSWAVLEDTVCPLVDCLPVNQTMVSQTTQALVNLVNQTAHPLGSVGG